MPTLLAILTVVVLTSPFGTATATAIDDTDGLTVEVTVEYSRSAVAVIARPFSDYEELPPTALVEGTDGAWIGWVELPTAQNWQIAFEAFESDGTATLSDGSTLTELGVDEIVIESEVEGPLPSEPWLPAGSIWLIVGIVSMVAALVLLSLWTFGSWSDAEEDEADEADEDSDARTTDADAQDEDTSTDDEESRDVTNGRE